jgi:hypothetical protein
MLERDKITTKIDNTKEGGRKNEIPFSGFGGEGNGETAVNRTKMISYEIEIADVLSSSFGQNRFSRFHIFSI